MTRQLAFWDDTFGDEPIEDVATDLPEGLADLDEIPAEAFEDPAVAQRLLDDLATDEGPSSPPLAEEVAVMETETYEDDDLTGVSFIIALLYLIAVLPLISVIVFFFKRLSINKLLKRVVIAGGSAGGLAIASAAYASVFPS